MTTAEQTDVKECVAWLREREIYHVQISRDDLGEAYDTVARVRPIDPLRAKAADLIERLSRELEEARATSDRLADSNYLAGATFGWNCAMEGAVEKFNAALRARAALSLSLSQDGVRRQKLK